MAEESEHRLVVVDCETTGFGYKDRIIEVAAVTLDGRSWEPVDEYDTLVNPGSNPERDTGPVHIHGITSAMVADAPVFSEIAAALAQRLRGALLIAHYVAFDARMLRSEFKRIGVGFDAGSGLCTLQATGETLDVACDQHGIPLNGQHRALVDARATAALAKEVFGHVGGNPMQCGDIPYPLSTRVLRREDL